MSAVGRVAATVGLMAVSMAVSMGVTKVALKVAVKAERWGD